MTNHIDDCGNKKPEKPEIDDQILSNRFWILLSTVPTLFVSSFTEFTLGRDSFWLVLTCVFLASIMAVRNNPNFVHAVVLAHIFTVMGYVFN